MTSQLRRRLPDLLITLFLFAVPLIFFARQTVGGRTLLPADVLFQWEPYRSLADDYGVGQPHNALYADLILENAAWRGFVRDEIAAGRIPLWQNNILAGTPFLAAGQGLTLYPFSVIYLIFPLASAYGWFTVSQLWLAGLSMYILVRVLGVRRPGALIAALTYQLSGFFMVSVVFPMILAAAAWLPLSIAAIELTLTSRSPIPAVALGAFSVGMTALAGHVEALYFSLLVMALFALWRLIVLGVGAVREPPPHLARRLGWLLAMVALGLALGAAQIAPAYELASRSFREGSVTLEQVRDWAYPLRHIAAFVMPNVFGSPVHHEYLDVFTGQIIPVTINAAGDAIRTTEWGIKNYVEGGAYVGILPMALAFVALMHWVTVEALAVARRRLPADSPAKNAQEGESRHLGGEAPNCPYRAIFAGLGLLFASFAFGLPTYDLLYYGLPFINQSHSPFRWAWPLTLCVAVLAGFGVQLIQTAAETPLPAQTGRRKRLTLPQRLAVFVGVRTLMTGLLILIGLILSRIFYSAVADTVQHFFENLALAPNAFPDGRAFYSYQFWNILILAAALILTGGVFLLSRRPVGARYIVPLPAGVKVWHIAAVVVVIADLTIPVITLHPAVDPRLLEVTPPSIAWLQDQQEANPNEPFRFMAYVAPGTTKTMNANIGWLNGLQDASGYDSLIPAQYMEYMRAIMPQGDLPYNRIAPIYADNAAALDSPLLDLLGVRYVVSEVEISNPRWVQVYQDEAVRIYENTGVMPRAFLMNVTASDFPDTSFVEAANRYDVRLNVIVPPGTDIPIIAGRAIDDPSPASITNYNPGEVWIDAEVEPQSAPHWLILTDSYFPGWRAWVRPLGADDSEETEIPVNLVDGNFRGVLLEPGQWTVRMKYSPDSFRFGAFASFFAALLVIFLLGVWVWPRLYKESGEGGETRRVARNTLTPILLNLLNKGILFALTFVSLRVLGPEGAGQYRYAVVVWGWFEILSNFGLNTYLTREVARRKDQANRYLANTTLMRLVLVAVSVPALIGFVLIRQMVVAPPLDSATLWAIGLLYAGLFFSTISTGLTALFYAYERAEHPAAIQTVSAFLTAGLGVMALLAGWGIIGLAGVSVLVNAVTLVILLALTIRLFFRPRPAFDPALQREALGESFPLMINHLLATLFFRIDVVLLEALQGARVVGWYGVVYTWVDAVGIVPAFFTLALFPRLSQMAADDRPALKRAYLFAVKLMTLLALPTALFTTLLAPVLVNILGGPEYLPHGAVALQIYIWFALVGWINSVSQYVIIALNRQRTLTWAFIAAAAFNITANLIYIPRYSYVAAAYISILSEIVLWGVFYVVILQELGRINWLSVVWRLWLAGGIAAGAVILLAGINMWLALAGGIVVYGAAALILRPFDADEMRRIAALLPEGVRGRLISRTLAQG